jgi:hypothetical protein
VRRVERKGAPKVKSTTETSEQGKKTKKVVVGKEREEGDAAQPGAVPAREYSGSTSNAPTAQVRRVESKGAPKVKSTSEAVEQGKR